MPAEPTAAGRVLGAPVLGPGQVAETAAFIASQQRPDGGIPWFAGGPLDPWDHVESAMALSAAGLVDAAERAYAFSAATQRDDGSWPMTERDGTVEDDAADTNQCLYLATGVWHHFRVTGDAGFLARLWPAVRRAVDLVVSVQRPGGELPWAIDARGVPQDHALLTGSSSAVQSLRCAGAIAAHLGVEPLRWRAAQARLAHAVRAHPERFADRSRWSMDWYYPVLAGVVRGPAARRRLARGWPAFVEAGRGARCVADRPWFTVAESCELVLALHAVGDVERARQVFADVQHLRDGDGAYWTGYVPDDGAVWPQERTTWTAAAVLLAADALSGSSGGHDLFTECTAPLDGSEPADVVVDVTDCACSAAVAGS